MSALKNLGVILCTVSIAASVLTSLIPQKRTSKLLSFVIGLFLLSAIAGALVTDTDDGKLKAPELSPPDLPSYSQDDMNDAVIKATADNLVSAADELLKAEGIEAEDIRINLKITDKGRIYVSRVVIYIDETAENKAARIREIVSGNLSKEPEIYVAGKKLR